MITKYGQYKNDFFNKLQFDFKKGKKILDVGCGDGIDSYIFKSEFGLETVATDIYKDKQIEKYELDFKKGSIYELPFSNKIFDYVYTHDVFHHIDEEGQREVNHLLGLKELRRVCKNNGFIIIVEANRFNPLFYPHMVLMKKHEHFSQVYFKSIIKNAFAKDEINFKFFEAHLYPRKYISVFKLYEWIMENFLPSQFLAYNVAIIKKHEI